MEWMNIAVQAGSDSATVQYGLLFLLFIVISCLVSYVYEIYFSPLAAFPGPRLWAVSNIPYLIATASGKQVPILVDLHQKYGGIVRVSPGAITVTDERGWADICGSSKYAKDGMAKDPRLAALVGGDIVNPDPAKPRSGQTHAIMRRAMVPALKGENVRKLEGMINRHVEEFLTATEEGSRRPIDMRDMCSFLICDLIADLFLGESLHLYKEETFRPWVHSFERFGKGVTILAVLNRFPYIHKILLFAIRRWGGKERDAFMQPIFDRFDRRVSLTTPRDDMLQLILDGDGTKQGAMPRDLLREFAPFLMLGGCEAMPTVLIGFVYFIFRAESAAIRQRLLLEVRSYFSSESDINMERVQHSQRALPYLEACLQESIRCYSPAATGTDRQVPVGGAVIAGQYVPGRTTVNMLHQVGYYLTENFAKPYDFIPERWLPSESGRPSLFNDDKRTTLHPFSVGPQSCFGQELSFYTLRIALCKMLYRFDIELTPESENWLKGQVTYSTRQKPPLWARVKLARH
ncbi:cytochrome P450, putative [Talaromyces stipitatus ATCC 10500]|uniref:Cytochrome P450, putative n=1 Tax=Talaromyces stipitatus (strain ATCC 10500 / CBS 375.48 / QM 6759 / NRRL 1006) TaxID=441959 RepID=B8MPC4_TALSN|nr:cytochrome P450, putative [Talaromyces stipitatus ATCC 10500]EED14363.1 cytochrome P450, putative [Talaromyces stipitatus ATCC 10500]